MHRTAKSNIGNAGSGAGRLKTTREMARCPTTLPPCLTPPQKHAPAAATNGQPADVQDDDSVATDDEDDDTTDDAAGGDHITFTEADLMNPQMVALQVGQHCTRPRVADATGRRQGNDLVAARPLLKATLITWLLAMSAERALSQPDEHAADLAALKPCTYDAAGQMQYMDPHLFNNADIVASGLSINWHWFKPVLAPSARWTASWVLSLPKVFVFKAVSVLYWGRSAFQNSRAQHRDPDHRQGLGMIESFVVSNGNAVLWGGTALWASDTVAPTHAGWLYLPLGVAALVAFWRHLHYGMRMMPVPGIVYQPINEFPAAGAVRVSIVAQVGATLAYSMHCMRCPHAAGKACTFNSAQKRELVDNGLLKASANELSRNATRAAKLKKFAVNKPAPCTAEGFSEITAACKWYADNIDWWRNLS